MERRRLFVPRAVKPITLEQRAADKPRTIVGYAAVFYREGDPSTEYELYSDMVERVDRHAFDRALAEQDDCRALVNHDPNQLIGRTTAGTLRLSIDEIGLRYEIDPPDTQAGRDVLVSIDRGDMTGSSFGFDVLAQEWKSAEGQPDVRVLKDLKLYDVSPVTYPAYAGTSTGLRAADESIDEAGQARDAWRSEREKERVAVRLRLLEIDNAA